MEATSHRPYDEFRLDATGALDGIKNKAVLRSFKSIGNPLRRVSVCFGTHDGHCDGFGCDVYIRKELRATVELSGDYDIGFRLKTLILLESATHHCHLREQRSAECGWWRQQRKHQRSGHPAGALPFTCHRLCLNQYLLRGYSHLDRDQQDLGGKSLDFTGRWRWVHACCFVDQLAWIARGRPLSQTLSCFRITMRTRPCFWIP